MPVMPKTTLFFHDYETFGADPARDRPVQFAGIRTDTELNEIDSPFVVYCQPAGDTLPHPEACLVTGITPQIAHAEGVNEATFAQLIHQQLARPYTCNLGYNSIRFDDEVTRFLLYRNFYDPYAREWQNGNSRWDLLDVVRLTYALRPEGINWPASDGTPSFRLEHLSVANNICHENAHDALSDVRATIALAKLIKSYQPRLYDYAFSLRQKRFVFQQINQVQHKPFIHVSGMFSAARSCLAIVVPIAVHPLNSNGVIVYDLSVDPTPLLEMDVEAVKARLFTAQAEQGENLVKIPLKVVHANKSPMIAPLKTLREEDIQRLEIDMGLLRQHYDLLIGNPHYPTEQLIAKVQQVFADPPKSDTQDPELMLYSGGFLPQEDREKMQLVREEKPEHLAHLTLNFKDWRLDDLLFRYRARNYPELLTEEDSAEWLAYRRHRLLGGEEGTLTLAELYQRIESLKQEESEPDRLHILDQLAAYGRQLETELQGANVVESP